MKGKGNLFKTKRAMAKVFTIAFLLQHLNPNTQAEQHLIATAQALEARIKILVRILEAQEHIVLGTDFQK